MAGLKSGSLSFFTLYSLSQPPDLALQLHQPLHPIPTFQTHPTILFPPILSPHPSPPFAGLPLFGTLTTLLMPSKSLEKPDTLLKTCLYYAYLLYFLTVTCVPDIHLAFMACALRNLQTCTLESSV